MTGVRPVTIAPSDALPDGRRSSGSGDLFAGLLEVAGRGRPTAPGSHPSERYAEERPSLPRRDDRATGCVVRPRRDDPSVADPGRADRTRASGRHEARRDPLGGTAEHRREEPTRSETTTDPSQVRERLADPAATPAPPLPADVEAGLRAGMAAGRIALRADGEAAGPARTPEDGPAGAPAPLPASPPASLPGPLTGSVTGPLTGPLASLVGPASLRGIPTTGPSVDGSTGVPAAAAQLPSVAPSGPGTGTDAAAGGTVSGQPGQEAVGGAATAATAVTADATVVPGADSGADSGAGPDADTGATSGDRSAPSTDTAPPAAEPAVGAPTTSQGGQDGQGFGANGSGHGRGDDGKPSAETAPGGGPAAEAPRTPDASGTREPAASGPTPASAATGSAISSSGPHAGSPARASSVTGQVLPEVARLVTRGDGTQRVTVKLAPEALGEVRIVLTVRRGEVHVRMTGSEAAQQALLQGQSDLHRLLAGVGATASSVQVGDQAATHGNPSDGGGARDEGRPGPATSDAGDRGPGQPGSDGRRDASGHPPGGNPTPRDARSLRPTGDATGSHHGGAAAPQDPDRRHARRLDVSV